MPRKKYARPSRKTYTKRKRNYRRRSRRSKKIGTGLNIKTLGFPRAVNVRLRYVDTFACSSGQLTPFILQIRGNAAYDPEVGTGGGSPDYFTEWADHFDFYRINASKIKVTFVNGAQTHPNVCILPAPSDLSFGSNVLTDIQEVRNAKSMIIGSQNGSGAVKTMKHYATTAGVFGLKKMVVATDDPYQASTAGNPGRQWYWNILLQDIAEASNLSVNMRVEVIYYINFFKNSIKFA